MEKFLDVDGVYIINKIFKMKDIIMKTIEKENIEDRYLIKRNYLYKNYRIIRRRPILSVNSLKDEDKKFISNKTFQNLINLFWIKFTEKLIFNEIATILSKDGVKLNSDSITDFRSLIKLALSN